VGVRLTHELWQQTNGEVAAGNGHDFIGIGRTESGGGGGLQTGERFGLGKAGPVGSRR
jgi:hypothetical protein